MKASVGLRDVLCIVLLISGCFAAAGCGGPAGPETAAVTGTVTMNGAPVEAGRVMFYPVESKGENTGKPAQGQLDSSGYFELTTYSSGDGAVLGEHIVTVLKPGTEGEAGPLGAATPERVTVKADSDNNFDITLSAIKPGNGLPADPEEEDDEED